MAMAMIRIWGERDLDEVTKHLLLAGELTANCENCQQLGINFTEAVVCPDCGTAFKYIAFRKKDSFRETLHSISRVKENRPDLTIIDYEDIKRTIDKDKAHDIFG